MASLVVIELLQFSKHLLDLFSLALVLHLLDVYYLRAFDLQSLQDFELTVLVAFFLIVVMHVLKCKEEFCTKWISVKVVFILVKVALATKADQTRLA